MRKRIFSVLAVAVASIFLMGASYDVARYNKLGKQMICMCGCNQILLECNHVNCSYSTKMTQELRDALERGESDSLVLQSFVQNYGATVLAAPTTSGFNIVAWVIPPVVFLLGLFLVFLVVRSWKAEPVPVSHSSGAFDQYRRQARQDTEL